MGGGEKTARMSSRISESGWFKRKEMVRDFKDKGPSHIGWHVIRNDRRDATTGTKSNA